MNHPIEFLLLMAVVLTIATPSFCQTADDYFDSASAKQAKGDFDGAIADYSKAIVKWIISGLLLTQLIPDRPLNSEYPCKTMSRNALWL